MEKPEQISRENSKPRIYKGLDAEAYYVKFLEHFYFEEAVAFEAVIDLAKNIEDAGGKAMMAGGAVRDEIMGNISKDWDIEVYGFQPEKIKEIAAQFGTINEVGASFGIIKLRVGNMEIDLSLPRRESKTGKTHKDFAAEFDPNMTTEEASRRRDFTMNSLAKNILTGEIEDYFGGIDDIKNKILRVTDEERFKDDALRILRGAQFVGRFGLSAEQKSLESMRSMTGELKYLPKERFREEWLKLFLKSPKPSLGLAAAMDIGIFEAMHKNEIMPLPKTPQEPEWHPEGDVWTHTLMVTDEAAKIAREEMLDERESLIVILGAFCHDLGKPSTTKFENGRVRSIGHDEAGAEPTKKFLSDIGIEKSLCEPIVKTVIAHLRPSLLYNEKLKNIKHKDAVFRNLAKTIYPATMKELACVAKSDHLGRGPFPLPDSPGKFFVPEDYPAGDWFLERANNLNIVAEKPKSVISGQDLIKQGFETNERTGNVKFGEIIKLADLLRDEKEITREEILALISESKERPIDKLIEALKEKFSA